MISFKILDGDIGIGLTENDLQSLFKGAHIVLRGKKVNQDCDTVVMYGKTEAELLKKLKKTGRLPPKTIVNVQGFVDDEYSG